MIYKYAPAGGTVQKTVGDMRRRAGSYILEAALSLPVMILCVTALALIIEIVSVCENICFVTEREVRSLDLLAYENQYAALVYSADILRSVRNENVRVRKFLITDYDCMFSENGIDDLIGVRTETDFSVNNPIGIKGKIEFTFGLLTRGFTGAYNSGERVTEEIFESDTESFTAVIFPDYGIRYHRQDCVYVTAEYNSDNNKIVIQSEDAKRQGYTPCKVCIGVEAERHQEAPHA